MAWQFSTKGLIATGPSAQRASAHVRFPSGHTTQSQRDNDVKTTSERRFDVIMTMLLRHVSAW